MKRIALAAVFALILTAAAFGAAQDFGKFTLDIPAGWSAKIADGTAPEAVTIDITKDGGSSLVSITYAPTDGYALEDLLEDWTNMEQDSTKPRKTDDGYYTYTFTDESGKKVTACVRSEADGKMYVSAEFTGKDTETMTAIRDSFALKK